MSKPPILPFKDGEGKDTSYFQVLCNYAKVYLEADGVKLNFSGYTEMLKEYANLKENQYDTAWSLANDLNGWAEYFSSLANLIQKLYLDAETSKTEQQAIASFEADGTKVANGDRLANKDHRVVDARKRRNTLKAFHDELEAKVKFLERAHYHCKATYDNRARTNQPFIPTQIHPAS